MTQARFTTQLDRMASLDGILGCALVAADTGLVWYDISHTGQVEAGLWEAAVEYWRLHDRNRPAFTALGSLNAVALHHVFGVMTVLPCAVEPPLLLIAIGGHRAVDWKRWQQQAGELRYLLAPQGSMSSHRVDKHGASLPGCTTGRSI